MEVGEALGSPQTSVIYLALYLIGLGAELAHLQCYLRPGSVTLTSCKGKPAAYRLERELI